MEQFSFSVTAKKGLARAGVMHTPHGDIKTPMFMPVGTNTTVKALDMHDLEGLSAQIILANTYHIGVRERALKAVMAADGVHRFMNWNRPVLTDSGGFQVFSLGAQQTQRGGSSTVKITEEGVSFKSHVDGTRHMFSPEVAMEIQSQIGADIIMAFDEATPDDATHNYAEKSLERTYRWAKRCIKSWEESQKTSVTTGEYQALFGIIQGGVFEDLRRLSAEQICSLPFDGIAIGGETIGYNKEKTVEILNWIKDLLPEDKPRYTMGLGRDPDDIVTAILNGVDMFDCVGPTRLARNGSIYHGTVKSDAKTCWFESEFPKGRLSIGAAKYRFDYNPILEGCECYTCKNGYTRAYLHHLYRSHELSYHRLASIHNVHLMVQVARDVRAWILNSE